MVTSRIYTIPSVFINTIFEQYKIPPCMPTYSQSKPRVHLIFAFINYKMGNVSSSSWEEAYGSKKKSSPKKSRVIAFHSTSDWNIYFDESKKSAKLMVIDFTATWCGPCKFMEPIIDGYADKYTDVEFIRIDVDELADLAKEFGVQAMPTFMLIKEGKVVDKVVGSRKDELLQKIEYHRV